MKIKEIYKKEIRNNVQLMGELAIILKIKSANAFKNYVKRDDLRLTAKSVINFLTNYFSVPETEIYEDFETSENN